MSATPSATQAYDILMAAKRHVKQRPMSRTDAFKALDKIKLKTILEQYALGSLPAEQALKHDIPQLHFQEYLEINATSEELRKTKKAFAEFCMAKANAVLELVPDTPQEAAVLKEFVSLMKHYAEKADPDTWGAKKDHGPEIPAVTINIGGNLSGLSHLTKDAVDAEVISTLQVGRESED